MKAFITELQEQLESQLHTISDQSDSLLKTCDQAIKIIEQKIVEIKHFINNYEFANPEEEISFFKEFKPMVYSKLIYYLKVYDIESRLSLSPNLQASIFENEIKEVEFFLQKHVDFYQYIVTGATHLDNLYFIRGKSDIKSSLEDFTVMIDSQYSTVYSCRLARVNAYKRLEQYLHDNIERVSQQTLYTGKSDSPALTWSASKTSLIELIYALHSSGVFNNGNADLKQIAAFFEGQFGFKLGDFYRVFQFIRIRKSSRTTFLDDLKDRLIRKMDEADENPRFTIN